MDGMDDMQYRKTVAARAVESLIWEIEGYGVGLWR